MIAVRAFATVIVTARGALDRSSYQLLDGLLCDLIDDHANLTVAVDLAGATVEPEAHIMLVIAACRARRHGTRFILMEPPADTEQALRSHNLGDLVEIMPRRTSPTDARRI